MHPHIRGAIEPVFFKRLCSMVHPHVCGVNSQTYLVDNKITRFIPTYVGLIFPNLFRHVSNILDGKEARKGDLLPLSRPLVLLSAGRYGCPWSSPCSCASCCPGAGKCPALTCSIRSSAAARKTALGVVPASLQAARKLAAVSFFILQVRTLMFCASHLLLDALFAFVTIWITSTTCSIILYHHPARYYSVQHAQNTR